MKKQIIFKNTDEIYYNTLTFRWVENIVFEVTLVVIEVPYFVSLNISEPYTVFNYFVSER